MSHPRFTGIFVIALGFVMQWPLLATLILWPFVIVMYYRLAKRPARNALERYPVEYRAHMQQTPMFFPRPTRHHGRVFGGTR